MDNPTTLIVSIMYVTIISIGLSNLLMVLSELVSGSKPLPDRVHLSWMLLMLLAYFSYFWQTTAILEMENWQFLTFIVFLSGPICLLFSVNLLIDLPDGNDADTASVYLQNNNRFFLLLGLFNVWIVGLDYLTDDLSTNTLATAAMALLCFTLMISKSYAVHKGGAALAWVLIIVSAGLYAT
jgi:hypothetical protein